MFDLIVAAIALTIACPLICVAALYLKVASHSPGFLREERAGRRGKAFRLIRLSPTGAGRIPTVSGISALPELVNVLRGEMSMVGPRPGAPRRCRVVYAVGSTAPGGSAGTDLPRLARSETVDRSRQGG